MSGLVGPRPRSASDLPPRPRSVAIPKTFPYDCNGCGDTLISPTDWWLHRCEIPPQAYRGERKDRCVL